MLDLNVLIPPYLLGLAGPTPCAGLDEIFVGDEAQARLAKPLCARCPVMEACGQWAIEHNERGGIWGGMTPKERRDSTRTPAAAEDCGSETAYRRHCALGEECEPCWSAQAVRIREDRERRLALEHAGPGGGSRSGYYLERVLGLPYCPNCRTAIKDASAQHKTKRRSQRLAAVPDTPEPAEEPIDAHAPAQAAA
ncbi:WhiB family transcriptional regulator [Streptomyces sp. RKAG337]|uniref:WhiB family transcriptional regulator n=1 Tax=Streptomyces sp. RKAG337 TaxID=2893404 RepID=UPI00203449C9|nr:WhiB family transcriptional regulator [Streptomyces sp. RKAG337]MCM2427364.1 WhiB family transcriptional regulator [Streptomyces sp. RKAG337]